jgi:hypothetical protein
VAKDKPNNGFIKELSKNSPSTPTQKPFTYSKPVNKIPKINSMATPSRSREFRSVKKDKTTSFSTEQVSARQSHKGNK